MIYSAKLKNAFNAGCTAFISKPINKNKLLGTINKLLQNEVF
jgi:YesN/AraC family two-component response regulator